MKKDRIFLVIGDGSEYGIEEGLLLEEEFSSDMIEKLLNEKVIEVFNGHLMFDNSSSVKVN